MNSMGRENCKAAKSNSLLSTYAVSTSIVDWLVEEIDNASAIMSFCKISESYFLKLFFLYGNTSYFP